MLGSTPKQSYLSEWQPDALRYTLASVLPEQSDSELTEEEMIRRNNEELVATWGNIVQREFTKIKNNRDDIKNLSSIESVDKKLIDEAKLAFENIGNNIESVELKTALQESMRYVSKVNVYLNETEPWKVIKEDKDRASRILYTSLQAIDACASLLYPFMPTTSKKVSEAIPKETSNSWDVNEIKIGAELTEIGHLFKKFD